MAVRRLLPDVVTVNSLLELCDRWALALQLLASCLQANRISRPVDSCKQAAEAAL